MNLLAGKPGNAAGGKDFDGKIKSECPRMEEIKRPEIDGAPGEVNPAGSLRSDGALLE